MTGAVTLRREGEVGPREGGSVQGGVRGSQCRAATGRGGDSERSACLPPPQATEQNPPPPAVRVAVLLAAAAAAEDGT